MAITGMTVKQHFEATFFAALDEYKTALAEGDSKAIVLASLKIHAAKSHVHKRLWPLVNKTFKETKRTPR